MAEHISPISIAQQLHQRDLFYFTPLLLADLYGLERRQAYRLLARLRAAGLVAEVERGKFLLLGLEPARVLSNPLPGRERAHGFSPPSEGGAGGGWVSPLPRPACVRRSTVVEWQV